MDDFFKKVKGDKGLKNFEIEMDSNKPAGSTTAAAPLIKENQDSLQSDNLKSDNLKLEESTSKPEAKETEAMKVDVISKPTPTELDEERKFSYFTETAVDEDPKPKVETEGETSVEPPNDLERMLEKVGDITDFLS